jgi:sugar phosphate isomerase/epimerase
MCCSDAAMHLDLCLFASTPDVHERGFLVTLLTGGPEELARQSLALGYDGLEFLPNPENVPDARPFSRALRQTGARLPVINSGRMVAHGLTLFHRDETVARRAIAAFRRLLEFAGEVEARVGLGIARGPARPDLSAESMDQLAAEVLGELAECADANGTVILLEPAETTVTRFILGVAEVMAWVDRINRPYSNPIQTGRSLPFDVMLDTHQLTELESSIPSGVSLARGQATHIHLFDDQRQVPGQGSFNWLELFETLGEAYCGSASVTLPRPEQPVTPQDVARFVRRVSRSTSIPRAAELT